MSIPVGQSRAHPLHAIQRSRARSTSGESQPSMRVPLTISLRTLARPRVESTSSPEAWYEGHITAPGAVWATHFPTPVQRWTSVANSGWEMVIAERADSWVRILVSSGAGSTRIPGLNTLSGSRIALTLPKRLRASGEYIVFNRAERARPSPCSPETDPPCRATSFAASVTKER